MRRSSRRPARWIAAAAAGLILVTLWARRPGASYRANIGSLEALREAVERHRQAYGRYPERLEDAGPVPPPAGLGKRHPGSDAEETLAIDLSRIEFSATFMTPEPVPNGAYLFGAWDPTKRVMTQDEMTCDSRACLLTRRVGLGKRMYGVVDKKTMASVVPMDARTISLRHPHGHAIIALDAVELPDTGQWAYDRRTGTVFLACTCRDGWPGNRPLYKY